MNSKKQGQLLCSPGASRPGLDIGQQLPSCPCSLPPSFPPPPPLPSSPFSTQAPSLAPTRFASSQVAGHRSTACAKSATGTAVTAGAQIPGTCAWTLGQTQHCKAVEGTGSCPHSFLGCGFCLACPHDVQARVTHSLPTSLSPSIPPCPSLPPPSPAPSLPPTNGPSLPPWTPPALAPDLSAGGQ